MRTLVSLALLTVLSLTIQAAQALEPKKIFDLVAPSTVLVEDVDRQASGVVLTDKGLILAPFVTVGAGIDLKVTAYVRIGGRLTLTEMRDVKVLKMHPGYQLALLEVKPPANAAFVPAPLLPMNVPLNPGSQCLVIGNNESVPGKPMTMGITAGLLSSASRTLENREYIQFSAALSSGGIGGPLCDVNGKVYGIAVGKTKDTEGINFAAPTRKLAMNEFVEPKSRKVDQEVVAAAKLTISQANMLAKLTEGQEKEELILSQIDAARAWILAEPAEVHPYNWTCHLYRTLGQPSIAQKFAEAAARVDPNHPNTCHLLGSLYYEADKSTESNVKRCVDLWLRGAASDTKSFALLCAEDIARAFLEQGNGVGAAYALRWAEFLATQTEQSASVDRAAMWLKIQPMLTDEYLENITSKVSGFTATEFNVISGSVNLGITRQGGSLPNSNSSPAPTLVVAPAELEAVRAGAQAQFAGKWRPVADDGAEVSLPGVPGAYALGGVEWQLAVHIPTSGSIAVIDLANGQISHTIECADPHPLLAAGGHLLACYSPSTRQLELHDLTTRTKVAGKRLNLPGKVTFMGMGSLNPSHIYILVTKENHSNYLPIALSVPALGVFPLETTRAENAEMDSDIIATSDRNLDGAMDETGLICVVGRPGTSPRGYHIYRLVPGGMVTFDYAHLDGPIRPAFAGGASGVVGANRPFQLTRPKYMENWNPAIGVTTTAIAGYPGFVAYLKNREAHAFRVHTFPAMSVAMERILSARAIERLSGLGSATSLIASAGPDVIAFIPSEQSKIVLFPLGLKEAGRGADVARPGKRFERLLTVAAGSKVVVQSAPEGLIYDAAKQAMVWDVPPNFKTGQSVRVIMLVTPPGGTSRYVNESIFIP